MKSLEANCVSLLCAGQVITCVIDALKELIENSLDAGARTIKVHVEDLGLKSITVTDDGCGVAKFGRDKCCLPHTTSKINTFEDLSEDLSTFGFRGEALHSLCVISDVTIVTKCNDEDFGQRMRFDHNGNLLKVENVASSVGTSVTVEHLLSAFPVRIREERVNFSLENVKTFFAKYFLAAPTVRFVIEMSPHMSITRPPLQNLSQAVNLEFGPQVSSSLVEKSAEGNVGDVEVRVSGLIPSPTCDWKNGSTSRMQTKQFIIVNGRPVNNSKIIKRINELCWKKFGSVPRRMARFVLSIDFFKDAHMSSSMIDVNLDPMKSHVMFSDLPAVMRLIDKIFSFETCETQVKLLKKWPSYDVKIVSEESATSVECFGSQSGCIWKDVGEFNDYSLFNVVDCNQQMHLFAVNTRDLLDKCGISWTESNITSKSEIVLKYWDQLIELHKETPHLFHLLHLS